MLRRLSQPSRQAALALIACAMLLRALIPAGWMPTTDTTGMMRIAICSGMGPQTVWMDRTGKIHKEVPESGNHDAQPCGFAVLGHGLDDAPSLEIALIRPGTDAIVVIARQTVSVGRGLAAPPPPSTGPPRLI